jgi:hypothetical protein
MRDFTITPSHWACPTRSSETIAAIFDIPLFVDASAQSRMPFVLPQLDIERAEDGNPCVEPQVCKWFFVPLGRPGSVASRAIFVIFSIHCRSHMGRERLKLFSLVTGFCSRDEFCLPNEVFKLPQDHFGICL